MNNIYDPVAVNDRKSMHETLLTCIRDAMAQQKMPDKSKLWKLREGLHVAAMFMCLCLHAITYFYFLPLVRWNVLLFCFAYYVLTYTSAYLETVIDGDLAVITQPTKAHPYHVMIQVKAFTDKSTVEWTLSTYASAECVKDKSVKLNPWRYAGKWALYGNLGIAARACSFERDWTTYFTRKGELYVPQVLKDLEFGLEKVDVEVDWEHAKQD